MPKLLDVSPQPYWRSRCGCFTIWHGDCLEVIPRIGKVDLVLSDPPYGTTGLGWDRVIPVYRFWDCLKRVLKETGTVVLFGAEPFSSEVQTACKEMFKYRMVWIKGRPGDVFNAKNKPMRQHEDVLVFSKGTTANGSGRRMTYNPQGLVYDPVITKNCYRHDGGAFKRIRPSHPESVITEYTNYPTTLLKFGNGSANEYHPTEKPLDLMEYLVKTFSDRGEMLLDSCLGSGTTMVACARLGRRCVGIEIDEGYCQIVKQRMMDELTARGDYGLPSVTHDAPPRIVKVRNA
jgi:site-specific DNA-methyltransferase (adenine-specific)